MLLAKVCNHFFKNGNFQKNTLAYKWKNTLGQILQNLFGFKLQQDFVERLHALINLLFK